MGERRGGVWGVPGDVGGVREVQGMREGETPGIFFLGGQHFFRVQGNPKWWEDNMGGWGGMGEEQGNVGDGIGVSGGGSGGMLVVPWGGPGGHRGLCGCFGVTKWGLGVTGGHWEPYRDCGVTQGDAGDPVGTPRGVSGTPKGILG